MSVTHITHVAKIVIGATSLLLGLAGQAAAAEIVGSRTLDAERGAAVRASDLDLSVPADAEALYRRIEKKARSMCEAEAARWDVKRVSRRQRCIEQAVDGAVGRANMPLLTAVHHGTSRQMAGVQSR